MTEIKRCDGEGGQNWLVIFSYISCCDERCEVSWVAGGGGGGSRYIVSRAQTSTLRPCVCPALSAGGNLDQHNCINKIGKDYSLIYTRPT